MTEAGMPEKQRGRPQTRGQQVPDVDMQALGSVAPQQQKEMLSEALCSKIHAQQPELAGKITGMLLEVDNDELLGLTTNDDALRARVDEAKNVYEEYVKNQGGQEPAPTPATPTTPPPAAPPADERVATEEAALPKKTGGAATAPAYNVSPYAFLGLCSG